MAKRRQKTQRRKTYVKKIARKRPIFFSAPIVNRRSRLVAEGVKRKNRQVPKRLRGKTGGKGETKHTYQNVGTRLIGPIIKPDSPCIRERKKIRRAYLSFKNSMPRGFKLNKGGSGRFDNKVC
jgi:hypothetical protein